MQALQVSAHRLATRLSVPILRKRTCPTGFQCYDVAGVSTPALRRCHLPTTTGLHCDSQLDQQQTNCRRVDQTLQRLIHTQCLCQQTVTKQLTSLQSWANQCLASAVVCLSCIVSFLPVFVLSAFTAPILTDSLATGAADHKPCRHS